ncbi:MAG: holo-ACP synthase [Coleofasciculus sp. G1-WW12-02]|uniref:holo-ACP synthase n=1 Tax=Coleofasciculus sp. G1-WW12-02 TaxID=3068483 RepID=UPI0032F3648B
MSQIIIGHGLEILETNHIKEYIERSGEDWEMEHFTATERRTPELGSSRIQYLASRFAVKQAVLKILGISVRPDISWLDMEVQRLPTGQPALVLYGKCQKIAAEFGITKWLLSISHTSSYVAASVLALRGNVTDLRLVGNAHPTV